MSSALDALTSLIDFTLLDPVINVLGYTVFEPILTGGLLWLVKNRPAEVQQIIEKLSVQLATVHSVLKVLFILGIIKRVNSLLNAFSARNWELVSFGKPWVWNEEVAVITGGAGAIATGLVEQLLPKGIKVALLDIQPPRKDILEHPNVRYYNCDMTSSTAVHEAAVQIRKELGIPTILVNNAGIANGASIIDLSDRQLDLIFKLNIMSHWYTVREFLPGMIQARKGHVMTVASMASYVGVAGIVDYCATKAGALAFHDGLTQEIRHLYNSRYIQTSIAHPFWTRTAMTSQIDKGLQKSDKLMTPEYVGKIMAKTILSGRGAHLMIPPHNPKMLLAPLLRAFPSWLNSFGNDTTKDNIMQVDLLLELQAKLKHS